MTAGDAIFQQYVRIAGPGGQQRAEGIRRQIPVARLSADLPNHLESAGRRGQRQCLPAGTCRLGQAAGLMVVLSDREKLGEHGAVPGDGKLVFLCEQREIKLPRRNTSIAASPAQGILQCSIRSPQCIPDQRVPEPTAASCAVKRNASILKVSILKV
jgi:hypothetical protein